MADSTMTDNEVAEAARKKEYVKMKETGGVKRTHLTESRYD